MTKERINVAVFCDKWQMDRLFDSKWSWEKGTTRILSRDMMEFGGISFKFFYDQDTDHAKLMGLNLSGVIFSRGVTTSLISQIVPRVRTRLNSAQHGLLFSLAREMGGMVLTY